MSKVSFIYNREPDKNKLLILILGGLFLFIFGAVSTDLLLTFLYSPRAFHRNNAINVLAASVESTTTIVSESTPTAATTEPTITPTPTPIPTPDITPTPQLDTTNQVFYGRGTPNNKIGMYLRDVIDDVKPASTLINSNGGDWGYILLTMNINDRNTSLWQGLFQAASNNHLIPIIQLFNASVCDPNKMDFAGLADLLNGLKWPSKHRYISIFNEVNAKDYWCDRIAPNEYAQALDNAIKAFKAKSSNFFIMPAAFNSSARTQDRYLSEDAYLIRMNQTIPGIFDRIDGWATHAYPQPNFSGDIHNLPASYGVRDSITNYNWEVNIVKNNFGVTGLPIFITETGWLHREGQSSCNEYSQNGLLSAATTSSRFKDAFLNYWLNDPRIVAIAPFIFKSDDPCQEGFAWQKSSGDWYPQASMLMDIPKTKGSSN